MKKLILLILAISYAIPFYATDGCQQQRMSKEEFRAKQKAFIIEKASLTTQEAERFFPMFFELQDRKQQLNDEAWNLLRKGKEDNLSEEQYAEILEGVYDARIAADRLEKSYYEKFKKVLSSKKIYMVQRAEMHFHRELLKDIRPNDKRPVPRMHEREKKE